MGLLSASVSMTRYHVTGELEKPIIETIAAALEKNAVSEIDDQALEMTSGWTAFETPYQPDFKGSSFVFGAYLIFSLRIDRKNIPAKTVQKYYHMEMAKKRAASGRRYLSNNEKQMIKNHVMSVLSLRIPSTPNTYDVLWNYEARSLWFFSNLKAANEAFESLFSKSFNLSVIRLFPYTCGLLESGLTPAELDVLDKLRPAAFAE
jgi:recombination associated protein RdgC